MAVVIVPRPANIKPVRGARLNPNHPSARGLIGSWLFNEGTGYKLADFGEAKNNGTLTNMTASNWLSTEKGFALDFDGSTEYVSLSKEQEFSSTSQLSIFAWIYVDSTTGFHTIVSKRNGTSVTFLFRIGQTSGDTELLFTWTDSAAFQIYNGSVNITENKWEFVGIVFDWNNVTNVGYYLNGVRYDQSRTSGNGTSPDDPGVNTIIGARYDSAHYFDGKISFLGMWDRLFEEKEAFNLYMNTYEMFYTI